MDWLAQRSKKLVLAGLAAFAVAIPIYCAVAKPAGQAGEEQDKDDANVRDNVFPTAERNLVVLLSKARQLIAHERYAETIQCLGAILEAPEDAFLRPSSKSDVSSGLKAEAQALLGRLPTQGRELYELDCGAQARKILSAAVAAGDANGLAEVSRRFFHTRAGYEATFLLGLHQWNHGSPLAAALTLKRLKESCPVADEFEPALSAALAASWSRTGAAEKARPVLEDLKRRFPKAAVNIAGQEVSLAGEGAARIYSPPGLVPPVRGKDSWMVFGGDAARNASVSASGPLLSDCWRVPTIEHPFVEAIVEQIQLSHRDHDRWALPALQPLVVDNIVLMRTARNLLAVDFTTGKRIWEVPGDDPFESLSESSIAAKAVEPMGGSRGGGFDLQAALRYRLWGDATFGTLASDGDRVFAIEDLSLDLGTSAARAMFMPNRRINASDPKPFNRLAAYDVHSGKLLWHVGGPGDEAALAQAGTFFLGAPLPVGGQVYAIGEQKGDLRLLVLNAKTGHVTWTQQLGAVDQDHDIANDPLRRISGVSPSFADGILVCPTSNRSVVALEPATRSLLWGYAYKATDQAQPRQAPMFFGMGNPTDPDPANRWARTSVLVAEGRVLITPVDSGELHCVSLIDGKPLWRKPREEDVCLACVDQGKVVLLGRRGMRALKLADGEPAWSPVRSEMPAGAMPSGTGYRSGDRYYLPLASGEVAAVELQSGKIVHVYQSRRGAVPGNLVCSAGRVLSQQGGAVDLFFQLDALRKHVDQRLAASPNDAEALCERGEILWDDGKLSQAIDCFRRSFAVEPSPNARSLLRDALLDGLRTDFERYRQAGDEIRRLIDEPRQEAAYHRLMAAGFEKAGQFSPALAHYLKLIEIDQKQRELEHLDKAYAVRRDRWLQVRLADLRKAAPAEVQSEIDRTSKARLDAALAADSADALEQFLDYFGLQPGADAARVRLVTKFREGKQFLQAEMLLRRIERSADRRTAGLAVAEQAFLLREARHVDDAALCFRRLRDEFADVVCREGKTGRQLADSLAEDDPVRKALAPEKAWPTGAIVVNRRRPTSAVPMAFYSVPVPFQEKEGPFFSDLTIQLHQNPPELRARDGWGKERWRLPLGELMRQENFPMSSAFLRVAANEHLLLLSMGFKIVAIDALAAGEGRFPKILWAQDLEESVKTAVRRGRGRVLRAGLPAVRGYNPYGTGQFPSNIPGAISEQLICYQRLQTLYGVDPVNGEVLWTREDIRPESVIFGDQDYVFVVAPGTNSATVLRAADGQKIDVRPVPVERPATRGRFVASWRTEAGQAVLEMIDPLDGRHVWPARKFAPDAKVVPFDYDREVLGVLEPRGHFALINLADGRTLVDADVDRGGTMVDVHVFRSPEQTLLVINGMERSGSAARQRFGLQGVPGTQIGQAKIYSFDPSGKPLWPKPVSVQDQYLAFHQPRRLPALVFACGVQNAKRTSPGQPRTAILAVDKRTGQLAQPKDQFEGLSHFYLEGQPDKNVIEIGLQRDVVTLAFTDKPVVASPIKKEAERPAATPSGALLKALQRGMEKALNLPVDGDREGSDDNG